MGTEENKMLVRRQFDEIWNGANWAAVDYDDFLAYQP